MPDTARLFRGHDGAWRWRRYSANHEIIAASSEGYLHRLDAIENYQRVTGPEAPHLEEDGGNDDEPSTAR